MYAREWPVDNYRADQSHFVFFSSEVYNASRQELISVQSQWREETPFIIQEFHELYGRFDFLVQILEDKKHGVNALLRHLEGKGLIRAEQNKRRPLHLPIRDLYVYDGSAFTPIKSGSKAMTTFIRTRDLNSFRAFILISPLRSPRAPQALITLLVEGIRRGMTGEQFGWVVRAIRGIYVAEDKRLLIDFVFDCTDMQTFSVAANAIDPVVDSNSCAKETFLVASSHFDETSFRKWVSNQGTLADPARLPWHNRKARGANIVDPMSIIEDADFIVLQISDLHFGKYHRVKDRGSDPISALPQALSEIRSKHLRPMLIVVTGDLTSVGDGGEYEQALDFLNSLASENCLSPFSELDPKQRILVLPGNHDNLWFPDSLKTDNLASFRKYIAGARFPTPFGLPTDFLSKGVQCFASDGDSKLPPFAVFHYENYDLTVGLLTTSFYSGEPGEEDAKASQAVKKICDLLVKEDQPPSELLRAIMEVDCGYYPPGYLKLIHEVIREARAKLGENYKTGFRFCASHHPVTDCGKSHACHEALWLRTVLKNQCGFPIVVHGHAHCRNQRPDFNAERASGVSCPALSCLHHDDALGCLLLCFRKGFLNPLVWTYESEGGFCFDSRYMAPLPSVTL